VNDLEAAVQEGITEFMTSAGRTVATFSASVTVAGIYVRQAEAGELGVGGMVNPAGAEFVYLASAASAPALLTTITVGGEVKRVMSRLEDAGMIELTLGDPEDVR
jgi:hypothetical protein